jgi:hypothetical protein
VCTPRFLLLRHLLHLIASPLSDFLSGAYAAIASFLTFSMLQFRDGPFIRPHPAFWRIMLGVNLAYELALVFLLFQDLDSARKMMMLIDPKLGVPLPEKSYADDCALTPKTLWVSACHFGGSEAASDRVCRKECSGYILSCACPWVVWESHDSSGLLVLLVGSLFPDSETN